MNVLFVGVVGPEWFTECGGSVRGVVFLGARVVVGVVASLV